MHGNVVTVNTDIPLEYDQFSSPHDKNISVFFMSMSVFLIAAAVQHVFLRLFSLNFACSSRGTWAVSSSIRSSVVCTITEISCYVISCMSKLEPYISLVQIISLADCFRLLPVVTFLHNHKRLGTQGQFISYDTHLIISIMEDHILSS
jgi:hypothetical protein